MMEYKKLRELDGWIAKHIFHLEIEDGDSQPILKDSARLGDLPNYSSSQDYFGDVKKQLEERHLSWRSEFDDTETESHRFHFEVINKSVRPILRYGVFAPSEELAGCLAIKRFIEVGYEQSPS